MGWLSGKYAFLEWQVIGVTSFLILWITICIYLGREWCIACCFGSSSRSRPSATVLLWLLGR